MTEDNSPSESSASTESSSTIKQRRKRKWDQPAQSFASPGVALPGILPLGNLGSLFGITLPGVVPVPGASLMNPLTASCATLQKTFLAPSVQQHATALIQKVNQPTIQEELIAREIVINDADSAVRYKLTKRQTQEEIQKCTGAVVITRGKYRPPNAAPDGEKPLYLHISAGAQLETTAERIKAVDRAAAMVEEMLRQGSANNGVKALSTSVLLGFEADPSFNIVARIRGPNDQFVNHIMNETGATVLLRGRGSGNSESAHGEEGQQPLHLFLSSNNPNSLEHAKLLAENLLDTISKECGASRISSCNVYGAVPPPQLLLAGVQSSGNELKESALPAAGLQSSPAGIIPVPAVSSVTVPGITTGVSQGTARESVGWLNSGQSQPNMVSYPKPSLTGGTSYSGYGGIYPQATPLQQVALALRQSTSPVTSTVSPAASAASTIPNSSASLFSEKGTRFPQKRKFQELPVSLNRPAKPHQKSLQELEFRKLPEPTSDKSARNTSTMPAPKKLVQPSSNGMPLAPLRSMPPPPPKFSSSTPAPKVHENDNILNKLKSETIPDTLIRLMEYGDDDDDLEENTEEPSESNSNVLAAPKPFWAL